MPITWEQNRWKVRETLASAIAVADNGRWKRVSGIKPITVEISGNPTGLAAKILISCVAAQPADSDNNHPQYGPAISGVDMILLDSAVEWVKFVVTAITGGSVSSDLCGTQDT